MGNKHTRTHQLSPQTIKELKKNVEDDFTVEEIKDWYNEFKLSCKNGNDHLTFGEFKEVYNSLFSGDASEFALHVFRSFDTDKDGAVDFAEFVVGLCVSGSSNLNKKLQWAFTMYDIDGDGYITRDEMTHIFNAILRMTDAVLPGGIDTTEQLTEIVFDEFDLNKDDRICRNEFEKCARENHLVLNMLQCDPNHGSDP